MIVISNKLIINKLQNMFKKLLNIFLLLSFLACQEKQKKEKYIQIFDLLSIEKALYEHLITTLKNRKNNTLDKLKEKRFFSPICQKKPSSFIPKIVF